MVKAFLSVEQANTGYILCVHKFEQSNILAQARTHGGIFPEAHRPKDSVSV